MQDTYDQAFCPLARGSEIFANRWTPIIIRNLLLGASTFSEIRDGAPGLPRSVLSERLRYLEHVGVVGRSSKPSGRGSVYSLTPTGQGLEPVCDALSLWGARWIEVTPARSDRGALLWAICKSMDPKQLPDDRVVARVVFHDSPQHQFWLVVQRPEPEVCVKPPGFDEDIVLTCETDALVRWHTGELSLGHAIHSGKISIEGPQHIVREFASWGGLSPLADIERAY